MAIAERLGYQDVEGLRVGRFGGKINTTCILWRIGDTLVDTGPPNQWRAVRRFVAERPLRRLLVTHHHEDHAGNLARLAPELEQALAPPASLAALADGFPLQIYRRVIWGRPARIRATPVTSAVQLGRGRPADGRLEPVLLPGHSPDMTCYLERRRRILFGADLYVARRQRYLRADEDLAGILVSLRRALELDFDTVLCSHRGVVDDAKERLRQRLHHFEQLSREAAILRARGRSVGTITRRLLGREDAVSLASRWHYSKRNLILGCLQAAEAGAVAPGPKSEAGADSEEAGG